MGSSGFGEIFFIVLIAAVIFGPNKLPELGRSLGKTVKEFKSVINNIDTDIREEVEKIKETADFTEMDTTIQEIKEVHADLSEVGQILHRNTNINPMKSSLRLEKSLGNVETINKKTNGLEDLDKESFISLERKDGNDGWQEY